MNNDNEHPSEDVELGKPQPNPNQTVLEIEGDVQSTSTGITSQFSRMPIQSVTCLKTNYSLTSLDELADRLLTEKEKCEDEDSFVTVDGCRRDTTTATEPVTFFSVNERTPTIMFARNEPSDYPPPPPYEPARAPRVQQVQYVRSTYPDSWGGQSNVYSDSSRGPPFRRNTFEEDVLDSFDSKEIRNRFVQKVYGILAVQLIFTGGFVAYCLNDERVKAYIKQDIALFFLSLVIYVLTIYILMCFQEARRLFPLNFIFLFVLTLAMSYILAHTSCRYSTNVIMAAVGITAASCSIVSLLSCQTSFDVTECGVLLFIVFLIVSMFGLVALFINIFTGSEITFLIYACLITIVFFGYLMYDTQQIMGGRRVQLSPEEYIYGALTLYIDIIIIFQYLLYIIDFFTD